MGIYETKLPNNEHPARRAAVIGAGPAGLVTAKTLMERGFDVTLYEKGSFVGGTWTYGNDNGRQFLYKNLHINTSKRLTAFSGFPFPPETQAIPDHRDMARYLAAYADHFGITRRICFRSPVREVTPLQPAEHDRPKWKVVTGDNTADIFDFVVVCSGAFDRPKHSPELRKFSGEYLHAAEYREPERYVGKHVCVVGAANSAVDIASDLCTTAQSVSLVARSAVKIVPHFIAGKSLNDIGRSLQRWWIPDVVRRFIVRSLVYVVHGSETKLGFKPLEHRVHPTISSTIVQDILFNRVRVRQGIESIEENKITFVDGATQEFDVVIAATGYVTAFPFLSRDILDTDKERLDLYLRVVPPESPGLYFVGIVNLDTPVNYASERQARWIAEIESTGAPLPSVAEMRRQIAAKHSWIARNYGTAARHSMQEESKIYYRELDAVMRKTRKRIARRSRQIEINAEQQREAKKEPSHRNIAAAANEPATH